MAPLLEARKNMIADQRRERERLTKGQDERWRTESQRRAQRFRRGLGAVMDLLTGKTAATRRDNETEAYQGLLRDRAQREDLFVLHSRDRKALQKRIDDLQSRQRQERMGLARRIMDVLRLNATRSDPTRDRARHPSHDPDLGL
jgi:hypothetical protein